MERIRIRDVDNEVSPAAVKRSLTDTLDASHFALNYYELALGESFAYGYHRHESQEEVFVVLSGTVTFETEQGDVRVGEGEVVRFAPGEYQQGTNRGDRRVEALVLGTPEDTGESEVLRHCPDCEERTLQTLEWVDDGTVRRSRCVECGTTTGRFTRSDGEDRERSGENAD